MSISILILTKDEEVNLPLCLEAATWSDDVVVLDSGSSDRTVEIARSFGARVFERPWDNEPAQRGYSLTLPFKYPWVYNPDADEVATPSLIAEMRTTVANSANDAVCYRVRRKDMLMGRWLRHASLYPTWLPRLFRPDKIRFERLINMNYLADGPEGRLREHMIHYSFNKGLAAWLEKHNAYSTAEASEAMRILTETKIDWRPLFSRSAVERRKALKNLSFRMPMRPILRFLYNYIVRGGVLDGRAGLMYCRLVMMYEFMIDIKVQEMRRREKGLPI